MNGTNGPSGKTGQYLDAAARLQQPLGALAEAMDEVERVAAGVAHSTYMTQVQADRAKWHQLETMTQPLAHFASGLADGDEVNRMLRLLAPSIVFPAATPMQIDFSGEMLHRAREAAELHKENLRRLISFELRSIAAEGDGP
ncbi:MAG: hypothetical protein JWQ01_1159 [Massilia sp.]|jgi:hypothetical protein|nr:hypothetical protein [Massilia sp.]